MAKNATQTAITKMGVKGIVQQGIGWILAAVFGLCSVAGITQIKEAFDVGMVIFCLAVTVGGIFLILSGMKKKKLIKTFKDYSSRFAVDATKSIDLLAASTGVTVAAATKNIMEMINNGFFANAYIDTGRNCLVFTSAPYQSTGSNQPSGSLSFITVQCRGCGATNTIAAGTVGECEFCGSKISEK